MCVCVCVCVSSRFVWSNVWPGVWFGQFVLSEHDRQSASTALPADDPHLINMIHLPEPKPINAIPRFISARSPRRIRHQRRPAGVAPGNQPRFHRSVQTGRNAAQGEMRVKRPLPFRAAGAWFTLRASCPTCVSLSVGDDCLWNEMTRHPLTGVWPFQVGALNCQTHISLFQCAGEMITYPCLVASEIVYLMLAISSELQMARHPCLLIWGVWPFCYTSPLARTEPQRHDASSVKQASESTRVKRPTRSIPLD